ncbi:MAG: iron dicitrate transport regulator FecR [Micromonosporaceae bacterium]|nr:iron dicitrate transport regulator FecR [Micromonosporaceae bacterium]
MDPDLFLADLEEKPAALRELATTLAADDPWAGLTRRISRVLLLGMGSSRIAAMPVAARLRAAGIDAVAEYASAARLYPPDPWTLVVAVSARGTTAEPIAAVAGYPRYAAVTNTPDSPLAKGAELVVPTQAGVERGGLASRSYLHALIMLEVLASRLIGDGRDLPGLCRRAADAIEDLLDRRDSWLGPAVQLLDSPDGFFAIAPAERISSAEQSALIVREGPHRRTDAGETGDWPHVDAYLTRTLDYRALFFPGSRYDDVALGRLRESGSTVVAVGAAPPGVGLAIRYRGDDDPQVRLLAEVLVGELVGTAWWSAAR